LIPEIWKVSSSFSRSLSGGKCIVLHPAFAGVSRFSARSSIKRDVSGIAPRLFQSLFVDIGVRGGRGGWQNEGRGFRWGSTESGNLGGGLGRGSYAGYEADQ